MYDCSPGVTARSYPYDSTLPATPCRMLGPPAGRWLAAGWPGLARRAPRPKVGSAVTARADGLERADYIGGSIVLSETCSSYLELWGDEKRGPASEQSGGGGRGSGPGPAQRPA